MYGKREISILPSFLLCPNMVYLSSLLDCHCHCCSVTQSCLILCDPVTCSMPGFPVLHDLPEFARTHVHWVNDAIQPSHPLVVPFSSCPQSFLASVSFSMRCLFTSGAKYWSFSFSISSSNEYSGLNSFRIDWSCCPTDSQESSPNTTAQKH